MKILLLSYGDMVYDGRLRKLIEVFGKIGEVISYTRGNGNKTNNRIFNNKTYWKFILDSLRDLKNIKDIDILVLDNRKSIIPGLILKKILRPKLLIQDCRELYLINEVKHLVGKIGCILEIISINKADIIISANRERAEIMKKKFKLNDSPLVYENFRKLEYVESESFDSINEKFSNYFGDEYFRVVSTSGCSFNRTNDILIKSLERVEKKCRIFLVGANDKSEEEEIKKIAKKISKHSVIITGKLTQSELKYLLSKCHLGIVNYGQYDTNNKYCASGKLFEFIYEGLPVVTTSNPPLKRICETENIGISDDNYFYGINEIIKNYDYYKSEVNRFSKENLIEEKDKRFVASLIKEIQDKISFFS